jgi:hypothetical protein
MTTYTVWVGGTEVTDYYLPLDQARKLKALYLEDDYDDVEIRENTDKEYEVD